MRTGTPLPPCIDEQQILALFENNPREAGRIVVNIFNTILPAITEIQNILNGRLGKDNIDWLTMMEGDNWLDVDAHRQAANLPVSMKHKRAQDAVQVIGGAGKFLQSISLDGRQHVKAAVAVAHADKAHVGGNWVVVNDSGSSTVEFSHATVQATASTAGGTGFHFNVVTQLQIDAKGHVSAATGSGFDANEHLSFNGTNLNHDNVASADTSIGTTNYDFNAISKIVLDAKGHVIKVDSTTVGFNAGSALTLQSGGNLDHKIAGTVAIVHRVDGGGYVTEVNTDGWGHVVSVT